MKNKISFGLVYCRLDWEFLSVPFSLVYLRYDKVLEQTNLPNIRFGAGLLICKIQ